MAKGKRKHNRQVYQVPSNAELDTIKLNQNLSEIVKEDMVTLHKINKGLKSMVMDSVKSCTEKLKDSEQSWKVVRIDIYTPHVEHPGDTEYVTNEVRSMVEDWWDEKIDVEISELSQAFIICMSLEYDGSGDPFGHFISITTVSADIEQPGWTRSTLTRAI